jgi:integrase
MADVPKRAPGLGRGALTDTAIRAWLNKETAAAALHDGGGLYLRRRGAGAFWALRQVNQITGKRTWAGLFPGIAYPDASLAEARRKAAEARFRAADGPTDLVRERLAAKQAAKQAVSELQIAAQKRVTVRTVFTQWRETELSPRLGADGRRMGRKDGGEYVRAQFERRLFPKFGDTPIADLKRADCMGVLDLIKAEGKLTTANRVYADLSQMLRFALKRDIVDRNPLDTITKRDVGGAEAARERVLDADEVKELVRRIPQAKMTPRSATAIWLIFATGCRVSEAMSARWEHVDLVARKWLLPETKNERDHTIHLSDFALHKFKTLAACRETETALAREADLSASPSPWVFPSADGKTSVCPKSFGKQLADRQRLPGKERLKNRSKCSASLALKGGRWTAHDLRRTAATMMAQLGISGDVIDECLNHMIESRVRRTYIRDRRQSQQVEAFDKLGQHLHRLTNLEE